MGFWGCNEIIEGGIGFGRSIKSQTDFVLFKVICVLLKFLVKALEFFTKCLITPDASYVKIKSELKLSSKYQAVAKSRSDKRIKKV